MLLLLLACAPKTNTSEFWKAFNNDPASSSEMKLPSDPGVHQGVLENGLHWYVEPNHEPAKRAELRLVVRAGSVLEDDDQRGLAHVLEHMAFNGTQHYPGGALVQWFESVGMQFGAHVNAYTSFDETVYTLTIPTDRPELLDQALGVLRDQGGGLLLDPAEIEKERGVVLEEWRTGRDADGRMTDALFPVTFSGSKYADRLPIGTPESIQHFDPAALRRFYTDWYRPDLMAVIAVGDFDTGTVEGLVKTHFGDLKNPSPERERPLIPVPLHEKPMVGIFSDSELTSVSATVMSLRADQEKNTVGDYRDLLIHSMAFGILNERYAERTQVSRDWLGAGAGDQRLNPSTSAVLAAAGLYPDKILPGFEALLEEVNRAQRFGFTQTELDRTRKQILNSYEQYYQDRGTADSAEGAEEIVRVFTTGESMPGTELEYQLARTMVPQISLEELNRYAQTWFQSNLVIQLAAPKKEGLTVPTEAELLAAFETVSKRTLAPPQAEKALQPLLDPLPTPGKMVAQLPPDELGFSKWTLSNGVDVWVKNTDYKADEILLGAYSPGGTSLASDADFFSAASATSVRGNSGLANFDPITLDRQLAGHTASAFTSIGRYSEGVSGSCVKADVETMLQLIYLDFVSPRFTQEGLTRYLEEEKEALSNRLASPDAIFGDALSRVVWQGDLRHRPWTIEDLKQVNLPTMERFYRERFADAADFDFVIVGSVEAEKLKPLVERYLGSLPAKGGGEKPGVETAEPVKGARTEEVRAGKEPKARVEMSFRGDFENTWLSRNRMLAVADILGVRLREELREERSGVYGVNVSSSSTWYPKDTYEIDISFVCDPARVEELKAATLKIVAEIQEKPVDAHYVDNAKQMNRRERETTIRSNAFWLSGLIGAWQREEDPKELLTWDQRNDSLTPAEVQTAAKQYLRDDQLLTFVLYPADQPH